MIVGFIIERDKNKQATKIKNLIVKDNQELLQNQKILYQKIMFQVMKEFRNFYKTILINDGYMEKGD